MREIPRKNYYILVILIITTILLTLSLVIVYKNREKMVSNFYKYSNSITNEEFDEYMLENSDLIIYISDKYDLSNESFERKFKTKLDDLNLKSKLIYIDKKELTKTFLERLKNKYDIILDINKLPTIFIMIDKKIIKSVYITFESEVDSIIDYEVFEW